MMKVKNQPRSSGGTNSRLSERNNELRRGSPARQLATTAIRWRNASAKVRAYPDANRLNPSSSSRYSRPCRGWHPQDLGAKHRRKGQRHEAGDDDRTGYCNAKLIEQAAGRSLQESQRGKYGDQGNRRRQHRKGDLPGAVDGCLLGALIQLFLVPVGVLQHDDGVIHHYADRQGQRQQGEVVDGKSQEVHDGECRDDRGRDGQARDDRGPQSSGETGK